MPSLLLMVSTSNFVFLSEQNIFQASTTKIQMMHERCQKYYKYLFKFFNMNWNLRYPKECANKHKYDIFAKYASIKTVN